MKLLTKELRKKMPKLYSSEEIKDPMVVCKFFTPWTHWTWYIVEGEPWEWEDDDGVMHDDFRFYGFVNGDYPELGYFMLGELEDVRGLGGLKIERDFYFKPVPLSVVRKMHTEGGAA